MHWPIDAAFDCPVLERHDICKNFIVLKFSIVENPFGHIAPHHQDGLMLIGIIGGDTIDVLTEDKSTIRLR